MSKTNRLPTIPQYYKQYVDPKVDLITAPTQPCPFHEEKVGKSFSYSAKLNIWRCFGQCHCGGDVIDLHKLNYHLKDRKEATESLYRLLGIKNELDLSFEREIPEVDYKDIYRRSVYAKAVSLANGPDDWLQLDYILSKVPYDVTDLEVFCASKGHPITSYTEGGPKC